YQGRSSFSISAFSNSYTHGDFTLTNGKSQARHEKNLPNSSLTFQSLPPLNTHSSNSENKTKPKNAPVYHPSYVLHRHPTPPSASFPSGTSSMK
ncbi:hypothetical protein, partial [Brevibacillus agri]